jgi:hypothetical protein
MNDDREKKEALENDKANELPDSISYDYIKLNHYREMFVTGVQGGITPHGYIQMSVFNERQPIPKQTVHKLSIAGVVEKEITDERLTRDSIVRSVEATLIMDIHTAEKTIEWIQYHVDKIKRVMGTRQKGKKS